MCLKGQFWVKYILHFSKKYELHNFVDDDTIAPSEDTIKDLTEKLETERKTAMDWFKKNEMIINPVNVYRNNKMSDACF